MSSLKTPRRTPPGDLEHPLLRFRSDLQTVPARQELRTLYRVVDPLTQASFELDELEYQVAQLLNGKRSAIEVSQRMKARGFHVEPRHVLSFHKELRGLGFLTGQTEEVADGHRGDAQVFVLQGQEYLTRGRPDLAVGLFEAAMVIDPQSVGAHAGYQQCIATKRVGPSDVHEAQYLPSRRRRAVGGVALSAAASFLVLVGLAWGWRSQQQAKDDSGTATNWDLEAATYAGSVPMANPASTGRWPVVERVTRRHGSIDAPVQGRVVEILDPSEAGRVKADTVIAVIEHVERGDYSRVQRLRDRVRELRALASESSVYAEFLRTTRRELAQERRAARSVQRHPVVAAAAGSAELSIERGELVSEGQQLGIVRHRGMVLVVELTNPDRLRLLEEKCIIEDRVGTQRGCRLDPGLSGSDRALVEVPDPPETWNQPNTDLWVRAGSLVMASKTTALSR